ncbi:MAG: endonuclease MutS2, partial [Fervidobacterium sp.]
MKVKKMENLVSIEKLSKNLNEGKIQYYSELKKRIDYDLVLEGYKTYCCSALGKEYLDSLNPYSANAEQELQYVSEITDFIRLKGYPDKDAFIDVRGILQKVENGLIVETQEFIEILRFLEGIKTLKTLFKEQKSAIFQTGVT